MPVLAAWVFTALVAVLVPIQIAAAAGAPLGEYMWGGQHEGRLPTGLRIGSACSIPIYVAMVLVVHDRAGTLEIVPDGFSAAAVWGIVVFLALGTLMNLVSRSTKERMVMTPIAGVLAASALVVALTA